MTTTPVITVRQPRLHLPVVCGVIERRVLLNFRCDPIALARLLPAPFRPKLVNGWGMAGICLIRLGQIRPVFLSAKGGLRSENAAHRIAVQWDENRDEHEGVFIPRRDTNSLLNRLGGGKISPGIHHAAKFHVGETGNHFKLEMASDDGVAFVRVLARLTNAPPNGSVFRSLGEALDFFRGGVLGWSACPSANEFDGLELRCQEWRMEPIAVERVESSFFENRKLFPPGSVEFDSAFLMRNIEHEWHARGRLQTNSKK
jgi:transposase InsO family protein